jgi:hypothetical protein
MPLCIVFEPSSGKKESLLATYAST